jgi:hypothetical protein
MIRLLAALLAPVRRPQPTRRCPTLADTGLAAQLRLTPDIPGTANVIPELEPGPEVVIVDLAALRRIRLDLVGPVLAWLTLAGSCLDAFVNLKGL